MRARWLWGVIALLAAAFVRNSLPAGPDVAGAHGRRRIKFCAFPPASRGAALQRLATTGAADDALCRERATRGGQQLETLSTHLRLRGGAADGEPKHDAPSIGEEAKHHVASLLRQSGDFKRAMDQAGPEEHTRIDLGLFHLLFDAIGGAKGVVGSCTTALVGAPTPHRAMDTDLDAASSASEEECATPGEEEEQEVVEEEGETSGDEKTTGETGEVASSQECVSTETERKRERESSPGFESDMPEIGMPDSFNGIASSLGHLSLAAEWAGREGRISNGGTSAERELESEGAGAGTSREKRVEGEGGGAGQGKCREGVGGEDMAERGPEELARKEEEEEDEKSLRQFLKLHGETAASMADVRDIWRQVCQ
jgi:hypothetical protein